MAKPESWQIDPAHYPFTCHTETRFQDLDPLGHINNVAMAALFENGRVKFNRSLVCSRIERLAGDRWLVARVEINYLAESHFPGDMEISSGIGRIGNSSWDIYSAAFQDGKCVATCVTTLVINRKSGENGMTDVMRKELESSTVTR